MNRGHGQAQPEAPAPAVHVEAGWLVERAGRVAGMVGPGWVTEAHAVEVLTDAACRDPVVLREAVVRTQLDPDMVPPVTALLACAADAAERPLVVRRHASPQPPVPYVQQD